MNNLPLEPKIDVEEVSENHRFDSWKEISAYLKKDQRTAQRWETERGLPVHRLPGDKTGGVFAYKSELDAWLKSDTVEKAQPVPIATTDNVQGDEVVKDQAYDDENGEPAEPNLRAKVRWYVLAALIAVIAVVAFRSYPRPPNKIKVMVRTLQNVGPGSSPDAFSQGMTDEIITGLGRANPEKLGVLARTTADLYSKMTISELKGLGLDYVIEGSVFRDQDRIRINTQLIDTQDGTQVSAKSYEGESKNVLDLQAAAAEDVVHSLKVPLKTQLPVRQVNPQAYDAYMRGQYTWQQRGQDSVANSLSYFKHAVELDPNYAPAYAGLADAYALLASTQYGILPPVEGFGEAKRFAERSIELDADLAAPHASLGYIYLVFDRNPEAARGEFQRALALDPNYVTAHQWFGQYYEVVGKIDDAIKQIGLAHEREPASIPVNLALAEAYYFKRDYDKAIEESLGIIQLEPTSALGHFNLGRAYDMKGWRDKAIEEFKLARANASNIATLVPLGYEYARAGDLATSTEYLTQLLDLAGKQNKYVPAIYFAVVYIGRGDKDKALTWLAKADQERCDYIVFLSRDPMVDSLRAEPRFEALVRPRSQ